MTDTGPGMTPEDQAVLFEAFQQGAAGLDRGGTGLGLTITQQILGLMESSLEVDSEVGVGTRVAFTVTLPPASGEVRSAAESDWSRVSRLAQGYAVKALVADDVPANRDILRQMLVDTGVVVVVAEDGEQALEQAEADPPDIAFLDIRMPVMDGLEALAQMQQRKELEGMKVVAISASALEHERQTYLEAGFDDFIDKPFRFERICSCMADLLGVEFDYTDEAEGLSVDEAFDPTDIVLPEALRDHLRQAAEVYSVTELEIYFNELEQLGEAHRKLGHHLRGLRQRHDVESIIHIVENVQLEQDT